MQRSRFCRIVTHTIIAASFVAPAANARAQRQTADSTRAVRDTTKAQRLQGVVVSSPAPVVGYVARDNGVALGFAAPVQRVPFSVQVVTRDLIDAQQPMTLGDIVRNFAGVGGVMINEDTFRSFKFRGFEMTEAVVDGIRNTGSLNIQPDGIATYERVEVLRGPGGALFGQGAGGGVLNVVTKKPLGVSHADFEIAGGNYGYVRPMADVTGPIGESGFRYRLVGSYEKRSSFIDFVSPRAWQAAPSLSYVRDGLSILYAADWRHREQNRFISLPFYGTIMGLDDLELDRGLFTGEPDQGLTRNDGAQHTLTVTSRLGELGTIDVYGRINHNTYAQPSVAPRTLAPDNRTLSRRFQEFVDNEYEHLGGFRLAVPVVAGQVSHTLSAGADYAHWSYDETFDVRNIAPIDIANPVYGAKPGVVIPFDDTGDRFVLAGGYVQDFIQFTDRLAVLIGARGDHVKKRTTSRLGGTFGQSTNTRISPRVGVSYGLTQAVTAYASYGSGLFAQPNYGGVPTRNNVLLEPEVSQQYEAGLKFDLAGSLAATASVYQLTRTNVPTVDPADPDFLVPTGEQRARGAEAQVSWVPVRAATVLASYAYTDARLTKDNGGPVGHRIENAPLHTARVWSRLQRELSSGAAVGVMGGVTYASDVFASLANDISVPGYTVGDAGGFARFRQYEAQVVVRNVTDEHYFARAAFGGRGVIPGDARQVIASLRWRM